MESAGYVFYCPTLSCQSESTRYVKVPVYNIEAGMLEGRVDFVELASASRYSTQQDALTALQHYVRKAGGTYIGKIELHKIIAVSETSRPLA
jgi:hypothetical protein